MASQIYHQKKSIHSWEPFSHHQYCIPLIFIHPAEKIFRNISSAPFPTHRITKQKTPKVQNKGTKKKNVCIFSLLITIKNKTTLYSFLYINDVSFSLVQPHCGVKNKKKSSMDLNSKQPITRKSRYVSFGPPACFLKQYKPKVI